MFSVIISLKLKWSSCNNINYDALGTTPTRQYQINTRNPMPPPDTGFSHICPLAGGGTELWDAGPLGWETVFNPQAIRDWSTHLIHCHLLILKPQHTGSFSLAPQVHAHTQMPLHILHWCCIFIPCFQIVNLVCLFSILFVFSDSYSVFYCTTAFSLEGKGRI